MVSETKSETKVFSHREIPTNGWRPNSFTVGGVDLFIGNEADIDRLKKMKNRPKSDKWKDSKVWRRLEIELRTVKVPIQEPEVQPIIRLRTNSYDTAIAMLRTNRWAPLNPNFIIVG